MILLRKTIKSMVVRLEGQRFVSEDKTLALDCTLSELFPKTGKEINLRNRNNQNIALSNKVQSFIGEQLSVFQSNIKVSELKIQNEKSELKEHWLLPLLQLHSIPAFMQSPIVKLIVNVQKQQTGGKSLSESVWKCVHTTMSSHPQFDDSSFLKRLRQLQNDYNQLKRKAVLIVNNKLLGLLILNNGMLGLVYYGTFHWYSWDVMQPIAYFMTASVAVLSLRKFSKMKREVTLQNWIEYQREQTLSRLVQQEKFNLEELNSFRKLRERTQRLKSKDALWFL